MKVTDKKRKTPLHLAALDGKVELLRKLVEYHIDYGVSIDLEDKYGYTPGMLACIRGCDVEKYRESIIDPVDENTRYKIVSFLVANDSKFLKRRYPDNNPLHWAIYNADYETSKFIAQTNSSYSKFQRLRIC